MENQQLPPDILHLQDAKRFRQAFYQLEKYRSGSDNDFLKHHAALSLGSATEYRMNVADRFHIIPPQECLHRMLQELNQGLTIDDSIAYLYWDLAVIASRYEGDNQAAKNYLDKALERDLQHPMVPALQDRIKAQAEPIAPQNTLHYQLCELLFQLIDISADETIPDKSVGFEDDTQLRSLEDYIVRGIALLSNAPKQDREPALTVFHDRWESMLDDKLITADAMDYGLEFVFRVCEFEPGSEIAERALQRLLNYLSSFSMYVSGNHSPSKNDLRKGKKIARRGLRVVENTEVTIDPDVEAEMWLALGQCSGRPADLQLADALDGYTKALVLKRKANNIPDVEKLEGLLGSMLDYAIQQVVGLKMGIGSAGNVHEEIIAAYDAAKVLADEVAQINVGDFYQSYLASISRPQEALEVLDALLNLNSVNEDIRFALRYEKAARLTEAKESPKAVEILEQLEPEIHSKPQHEQCIFWNCYSNAMRELEHLDQALEYIDKAMAVKPEKSEKELDTLDPMLHTNRAQILLQLGRAEEAEAELKLVTD
ncbi:MAG: hypothetical protein GY792_27895 [Gammaproteobacteria bacterium]|nr:hypothetical protein [Gammaproteobacteria bacterium]